MNTLKPFELKDFTTLRSAVMSCDLCGFEDHPSVIAGGAGWMVIKRDNFTESTNRAVCRGCIDLIQKHIPSF